MVRYGSITARSLCIECTGAVYHITFRGTDGTSSPLVAGQPVELGGVVIPLTNPFPGDYDGDGKTDYGFYRPSTGVWFIKPSGGVPSWYAVYFGGGASDIPLTYNY